MGKGFYRPDGSLLVDDGGGAGSAALDDLTDVVVPSPSVGDLLQWDGSDWVNVPAGAGGTLGAYSYLGHNSIGASTEALVANRQYMQKIPVPSNGFLMNLEIYVQTNAGLNIASFGVGALEDSAGAPLTLRTGTMYNVNSQVVTDPAVPRWFGMSLVQPVTAGDWWIAFSSSSFGMWTIYYDAAGSDQIRDPGGTYLRDANAGVSSSTKTYSMRAAFLPTA